MPRQNMRAKAKKVSTRTVRAAKRSTKTRAKRAKSGVKRHPAIRTRTARASHPDAIALLKQDHRELLPMLQALHDAPAGRRDRLLERIEHALRTHTRIEEETFYPAFRDVAATDDDRRLFHEALEEHHAADILLREVAAAVNQSDAFAGRAKVLKEIVRHHAEEEEREMFPRARRLFPSGELKRLGEEMQMRKRALSPGGGALAAVAALFSR
jgi:hemerythrin-like domain-containing protein